MPIGPEEFKAGMRQLAGAVCLVTCEHKGTRGGLTATAVMSLTAEPPQLAIAVNRSASAVPLLMSERNFAINLLDSSQYELAARFAGAGGVKGEERFAGSQWSKLVTGAPVLVNAPTVFDCRIAAAFDINTHILIVGGIEAVQVSPSRGQLMYQNGQWSSVHQVTEREMSDYESAVTESELLLDQALRIEGSYLQKLLHFVERFTILNIAHNRIIADFSRIETMMSRRRVNEIHLTKRRFDDKFESLLGEGARAGEFSVNDASLTALTIIGTIGWVARWFRHDGSATPDEVASRISDLVSAMIRSCGKTDEIDMRALEDSFQGMTTKSA